MKEKVNLTVHIKPSIHKCWAFMYMYICMYCTCTYTHCTVYYTYISFTLCIFLGTGGGTGSLSLLRPAAISLTLRNGEESGPAPELPSFY